ncbi:MAG: hypothetical protein Kow0037_32330 [Calditrichia bacterium]
MQGKIEALKRIILFKEEPDEILEALCKSMKIHHFKKGDLIIREGEPGNSLFIILEGDVSITKKMTLLADDEERSDVDKALIRLKAEQNAFFGEMALCSTGEKRSATVKAGSDCVLGEISAETIEAVVARSPEFGVRFYKMLSRVLAERLRKANRDILKLTTVLTIALEE